MGYSWRNCCSELLHTPFKTKPTALGFSCSKHGVDGLVGHHIVGDVVVLLLVDGVGEAVSGVAKGRNRMKYLSTIACVTPFECDRGLRLLNFVQTWGRSTRKASHSWG